MRKKTVKIFSLLLVVAILAVCLSACGGDEDTGIYVEAADIKFEILKDENGAEYAEVKEYLGSGVDEVSIPASVSYDGREVPVTTIGSLSFEHTDIVSLIIPEGVKTVKNCAIFYAEKLVSISLPSTLEKIGSYGFYNCPILESATFKSAKAPVLGEENKTSWETVFQILDGRKIVAPSKLNIYIPSDADYSGEETWGYYLKYIRAEEVA